MEKFVQRENVLVEYQQPGGDDMDFNDVFGGPPRRYSMQEVSVRYSFGSGESEGDDLRVCSSPWGKEKPVFGEEVTPRRRHQGQGDDFFGDIFRSGDESFSSPRRGDRNSVFGTSPAGSRSMSPARGSVSRGEPYGTSLPAQFSLPAKLTKSMEIPTFAPNNHGQQRMDGSVKGINSSHSSNLLSRFSSRVTRGQDEVRVRQSPLFHHASLSNEDSPSAVRSHHKENAGNLKNDAGNADNLDNPFHFSIYKWAGQGVPMMMPLVGKKTLQPKDTRTNGGRIESDNLETDSWKMESKKDLRSKEGTKEAENYFEGLLCETSMVSTSRNDSVVPSGDTQNTKEEVKSVGEIEQKPRKSTTKPLHVFLSGAAKQPGKVTEVKRNKNRSPKGVLFNKHAKKNVMNDEETGIDGSSSATIDKSSLSGAAINSGIARGKSVVKGKVKDFVQIFNQEAESVPKADVQTRSRGFRWKATSVNQKENEVNLNAGEVEEKVNLQNANKNPDVSPKADENKDKDEAQHPHIMNSSPTSYNISANQANAFSSESLHKDSMAQVENSDEPLEDNFQVQELSDDHEKVTEEEGSEDMKALDTKIQQWSFGKKGNIRSLLSTLQYVLWPGSGWKPVPLVDLIEANSVKRAYQKALLRLHPDKLQQKGAPFHHKYMAEKVFDILQEAWDHFNTLAPL